MNLILYFLCLIFLFSSCKTKQGRYTEENLDDIEIRPMNITPEDKECTVLHGARKEGKSFTL